MAKEKVSLYVANSALKSCLRNLDSLEKPIAEQYVPVFKEFLTNLYQLSKTNGVALQIVQCFSLEGKAKTISVPKGDGDATSNPSGLEGESGASTAPRRTRT